MSKESLSVYVNIRNTWT